MVYLLWLFSQNVIFKDLKKNLSLYLLLLIYHLKLLNAMQMIATPDFKIKKKSLQFLEILNKQDSSIQYTIEFENNQKQLNFLDITITNNGTDSYDFKIFRKPAVQIKPYKPRTYKSNPTQTWQTMFPFQFLKDSYQRTSSI